MVDVSIKSPTVRRSLAQCEVIFSNYSAYKLLKERKLEKGDAIQIAEVAGIMAAKRTSDLIPLCHQIALDFAKVSFEWSDQSKTVVVLCESQVTDKTGCEMEALTGASLAALTVYDMCKGVDKSLTISNCRLLEKSGGKSGDYKFDPTKQI